VLHLGPVGSGQLAKILNNTLMAAHLGTADAIFTLGRELGVEPAALAEVIGNGSGRSFAATLLPGMGFALAPLATVAGPLLQKDVRLLVDLAGAADADPGVVLPAADAALAAMDHSR
jgi:3-hydroxyisobutyrate dehydrogenase-like beta-hydroxyacid dehydrogenase